MRLDPWHTEFEMILTSSRYDLPFSLSFPDGFATAPCDIGLYEAFVRPNMLFSSPMFAFPHAVAALLFYKSAFELRPRSVDYLLTLSAVVDRVAHPLRVHVRLVTAYIHEHYVVTTYFRTVVYLLSLYYVLLVHPNRAQSCLLWRISVLSGFLSFATTGLQYTCQEFADWSKREVRWRMSKKVEA